MPEIQKYRNILFPIINISAVNAKLDLPFDTELLIITVSFLQNNCTQMCPNRF